MVPRDRLLIIGLVLALVGAGVLLVVPGRRAAEKSGAAGRAQAAEDAHAPARPRPPPQGSGLYQSAPPVGRRFDPSQVYDPAPPPPGRAPSGIREYTLVIEEDVPHEVAPGVVVPAWTFNRTVPGPVLRATEGETLRITLVNKGSPPHPTHFHGL